MKRIATTLLALATAACFPLAAQDAPTQPSAAPNAATPQATGTQDAAPQDKPADRKAQPAAPAAQGGTPAMGPEQQAKMQAWMQAGTPGAQHRQLADQFAGNWTIKSTMWMDPSLPPVTSTATASNSADFSGRHLRWKIQGEMMGQPFQGESLTSYDNTKGKYVNLWIDSMATAQYVSEGSYDPATKTYTFTGTNSDPTKPGKRGTMKDVIRIADKDNFTMESFDVEGGKDTPVMKLEYTRAAQ